MSNVNPSRVAALYLGRGASRTKTAGEVRFIKDRGGDKGEWGWGSPGPSERETGLIAEFVFNAKYLKPLACTLRSALMALGHVTSAHAKFVKIKSRNISPDGNLGGKGYIQKIPDMRRQLMNVIEALSAYTDTVYDEIQAPHWNTAEDTLDPRDRDEVKEIVQDVQTIKDDPEGWAEDEEDEMDEEHDPAPKKARTKQASRLVSAWNKGACDCMTVPVTPDELEVLASSSPEMNAVFKQMIHASREGGTLVIGQAGDTVHMDFLPNPNPDRLAYDVAMRYLETL